MKKPANCKAIEQVEFTTHVRIPTVGLRKEAMMPSSANVIFAHIEGIWESNGKVFVSGGGKTRAFPMNVVSSIDYCEEQK